MDLKQEIEELKAIMNVVPTDDLTAIKISHAVESFRVKHPQIFRKIFEKKFRENVDSMVKNLFDQWRKKAGYG